MTAAFSLSEELGSRFQDLADPDALDLDGTTPASAISLLKSIAVDMRQLREDMTMNLLVPRVLTGELVIDESAADWSNYQNIITITPDSSSPLREVRLDLDLAKATTGFAAGYAAQTLTLQVYRKTDGTNWRGEAAQSALSGTNAAGRVFPLSIGIVGVADAVKVMAKLSAENGGSVISEIPYRIHYLAATAPTVVAAEAA